MHEQDEEKVALSPARGTGSLVPQDESLDEDDEVEEEVNRLWGKLDPHNDLELPRYVSNVQLRKHSQTERV